MLMESRSYAGPASPLDVFARSLPIHAAEDEISPLVPDQRQTTETVCFDCDIPVRAMNSQDPLGISTQEISLIAYRFDA